MPNISFLFMGEYTFSIAVGTRSGTEMNSITLLRADFSSPVLPRPGATRLSEFRLYRVIQDGVDTGEYMLKTRALKLSFQGTEIESEFKVAFTRDGEYMVGSLLYLEGSKLKIIPPELAQDVRFLYRDQWIVVRDGKFWPQPDDSMFAKATWRVKRTLGPSYAGAELRYVDLRAPFRMQEDFTTAKLGKASLSDTQFIYCKFDGADLSGAACHNTKFGIPGIAPSSMNKAIFADANISGAQFYECPLAEAQFCKYPPVEGQPGLAVFSPATSFERANLRGAKFAGANLAGVNFSGADLTDADFKGAKFGNATLSGAILEGAILDGADLRGVQFAPDRPPRFHAVDPQPGGKKASLVKAKLKAGLLGSDWTLLNLTDAEIEDIPSAITQLKAKYSLLGPLNLSGRNLTNADFTGSTLKSVTLNQATLTGAVMTDLDLRTTTLTGATLTDAVLSGANLRKMTINGAVLTRVKMVATDCTETKLTNCTAAEPGIFSTDPKKRTCFQNAEIPAALLGLNWEALDLRDVTIVGLPKDLTKLNAKYALLHGINLSEKILKEAKFDWAELRRGSLASSDLTSASFRNAFLQGADNQNACSLSKAFMKNAIFDDANLTGVGATYAYIYEPEASMVRATLAGCDFSNAYLSGVNFSGISGNAMKGVKFSGACLINANFNGVKFSNYGDSPCSLTNACLHGVNFLNATLSGTFMRDAAVSVDEGKIDVWRRTKYRGEPVKTTILYKATKIDPASATTSATECPTGGNGPCDGKLISPDAPKSWRDSSGNGLTMKD